MLANGVVDACNICHIVARISLLLVMDTATMGVQVRTNPWTRREFDFAGQFRDVPSFVTMLTGDNPTLQVAKVTLHSGERSVYGEWLQRWKDWKIRFSQFVTLPEPPTDTVLWKMLDRRASGILPHKSEGA